MISTDFVLLYPRKTWFAKKHSNDSHYVQNHHCKFTPVPETPALYAPLNGLIGWKCPQKG